MMENLFNKLTNKPREETRLRIIRRNLMPDLQRQIALVGTTSLADLVEVCQQIEEVKARASRLKPPPSNPSQVTERDLMYRRPRAVVHAVESPTQPPASCWNCSGSSHLHRQCPNPPQERFCFRSGKENVTTRTCTNPNCLNLNQRRQRTE